MKNTAFHRRLKYEVTRHQPFLCPLGFLNINQGTAPRPSRIFPSLVICDCQRCLWESDPKKSPLNGGLNDYHPRNDHISHLKGKVKWSTPRRVHKPWEFHSVKQSPNKNKEIQASHPPSPASQYHHCLVLCSCFHWAWIGNLLNIATPPWKGTILRGHVIFQPFINNQGDICYSFSEGLHQIKVSKLYGPYGLVHLRIGCMMKRSNACSSLRLVVCTRIWDVFSALIWLSCYKKQGQDHMTEDNITEVAARWAPTRYKWSRNRVNMGSRQSLSTWICLKKLAGFLRFSYLATRSGFTGISSVGLHLSWVISTTQHDQTYCSRFAAATATTTTTTTTLVDFIEIFQTLFRRPS